jgi:tRNA A37 threonylcarbamoyladenosine dehydratase
MLLGHDNIEKLKNRRAAVFGIGGVGGHCAEALCRAGIGALDLFDGDTVDITNINRQIIATHKTLGRDKADVMRERLLEINPDAAISARKLFYLPEAADEVDLSVYDYIVDAVDTITAKLEIVRRAKALGIPVISSMGAANKLDAAAFEVADIFSTSVCPVARVMRRELRKIGVESLKVVYSKEPPITPLYEAADETADDAASGTTDTRVLVDARTGGSGRHSIPASVAFVPPVAGLIMAGEVIKDLLHL